MSKFDVLDRLTDDHAGYLFTSTVQDAGISRTYLSHYIAKRKMERVGTGIYIVPEVWPDPLYILQLKNREIIFSHETALYLHGLMDCEPAKINVSVRRGYNATHLIKRGIKPYFIRHELFKNGISTVKTCYGNNIICYDIDRTICDTLQRKDNIDIQIFQTAIKEYISSRKKNLHNLIIYSRLLGIEQEMRKYTEILL